MDSHNAVFAKCISDCFYTVRNFNVNPPFIRAGHYTYVVHTGLGADKKQIIQINQTFVLKESLTTEQANRLE